MVWNSDTHYALGLYRKIGWILGIWSPDFGNIFSNIRLAFVIMLTTYMCFNFLNQLFRNDACATVTEIVDIIGYLSGGISVLIKLTILITHQNSICIIVNRAIKDWSSDIIDHRSRSIMLRYAGVGRKIFISQAVSYCIVWFSIIYNRFPSFEYFRNYQSNSSSAIIIGVPLWPDCWIQTDISMKYYTAMFILQSITLAVINASFCNFDCFFFGMVMHLCGQFQALSTNFEYFHEGGDREYYNHQLIKLVKRHRYLLKLANRFEDTYNLCILIHVGVATMIICVTGLVLLDGLQSSDFVIVVDMASRIFVTYLQLIMYCYAGEQLRTEAMNLKNIIHNSSWFDMPLNTVKEMILIIIRSDCPINLTAGKIFTLNLPNFISIVKTISSYFSVIRLTFKKDI
ncbi:hypothetical protein PV327_001043 [Microctonus hyperodae]|uniref:Odorant receptor n=1 Tax=Microctonus hyperodae TaxID=165561 RepID=A0AA39L2S8_MICHY|nr:hypothetical protein PV327_001043 [Microctonus hyperodae]